MTSRAAAVALAASALIAAPALADEGHTQSAELLGSAAAPQTGLYPGEASQRLTLTRYDDDDDDDRYERGHEQRRYTDRGQHDRGRNRGHHGNNNYGYNVRTDRYGNPIIRCSSGDYRTQYCAAPQGFRIRDVRLVNRRSSASCDYGSDWGFNRDSVWGDGWLPG